MRLPYFSLYPAPQLEPALHSPGHDPPPPPPPPVQPQVALHQHRLLSLSQLYSPHAPATAWQSWRDSSWFAQSQVPVVRSDCPHQVAPLQVCADTPCGSERANKIVIITGSKYLIASPPSTSVPATRCISSSTAPHPRPRDHRAPLRGAGSPPSWLCPVPLYPRLFGPRRA